MKKMKYTAPECEIFYIQEKTAILDESRISTSGNPDDKGVPIKEGDLPPGVHTAKQHGNWDDGVQDVSNGWGDLWQ